MRSDEPIELRFISLFQQISKRLWQQLRSKFKRKFSLSELSVLLLVHKKKSLRVSEIARLVGVPASTLSGILDRLEKQKLIQRKLDPKDKRGFTICGTNRLAEIKSNLTESFLKALKEIFSCLSKKRLENLIFTLEEVLQNISKKI